MSVPQPDLAAGGASTWRHRPANRTVAHLLNLVFLAFGVFSIIVGYNSWAAVQPIAGGTTTSGTITSVSNYETCGRYGCRTHWTPTIQFQANNGTSYTFIGPTTDSYVSAGDAVMVSYLPSNPNVAHDLSASDTGGVLFLGFGVFAAVLGLGSFVLGLAAVHRRTGLSSARPGGGWVGHKHIHSNQGALTAVAVVLALMVMAFFVV